MKIGILGGTFDPIHFGHIHLALSLKEACELDQVLFSPNQTSPFKEESSVHASPNQRLEMLHLALKGVPGCKAIDYEVCRSGPSYTIDLVRHVKSLYTDQDRLFLLLGEDLASEFPLWKEYEQILSWVTPVVGCRSCRGARASCDIPEVLHAAVMPIPLWEISSSQIRARIKNKLYCQHLISESVFDYICKNKLYL